MSDDPRDGIFGGSSKHPDRPDTPDFWRLSEIMLRLDGSSTEHGADAVPLEASKLVDLESISYVAQQRAQMAVNYFGLPPELRTVLTAAMFEGFLLGAEFQAKGGHRE